MSQLLLRLFVKNYDDVSDPAVRSATGNLASVAGIVCNILLFGSKLLIGTMSSSVAVTADAFNNLSDAASNVITLLGFRIAGKPADEEHPYGHARFEYIASLAVAVIIILVGWELGKAGIERIIHPDPVKMSLPLAAALVLSIMVKGWMSAFNRTLGRRIDSQSLLAAAADSRNDIIATTTVIVGALLSTFGGINIDGWLGVGVALFIIYSGIGFMREASSMIMGVGISQEEREELTGKIMSYDGVLGVHDLMIHDYGAGKRFGSVHCEMDSSMTVLDCHRVLDRIETDLKAETGIDMSIHLDPVKIGDEVTDDISLDLKEILSGTDPDISFHDLHVERTGNVTDISFDLAVPYGFRGSEQELIRMIEEKLSAKAPKGEKVSFRINFDRE